LTSDFKKNILEWALEEKKSIKNRNTAIFLGEKKYDKKK